MTNEKEFLRFFYAGSGSSGRRRRPTQRLNDCFLKVLNNVLFGSESYERIRLRRIDLAPGWETSERTILHHITRKQLKLTPKNIIYHINGH